MLNARREPAVERTQPAKTGADLRAALADVPPPDDRFAADIADALTAVADHVGDPWGDA